MEEEAMDAVLADMGRAAREFKAKKYAPKPQPAPEVVEAAPEADGSQPTMAELAAMLGE